MTWNNAPPLSASTTTSGALSTKNVVVSGTNAWYEFDITSFIRAELAADRTTSTVGFHISAAQDLLATFNSAEASANQPQLVIDYSSAQPSSVPSSADAYVYQDTPTTNNGTAATLRVKQSSTGNSREVWMKFPMDSVPTGAHQVTLRLWGRAVETDDDNATTGTLTVAGYSSSNTSWTETGINWNNSRTYGLTTVGDQETITGSNDHWYTWDVTSYVNAQRSSGATAVTLVLTGITSTTPMGRFLSREGADGLSTPERAPQLLVVSDPPIGQISGSVFADLDGDGVLDAGEPAAPNVPIYLDQNNDGVFGDGDYEAITDDSGLYSFANLAVGLTYRVKVSEDTGWVRTKPSAGYYSASPTTAIPSITGDDFGVIPPPPIVTVFQSASEAREDDQTPGAFTLNRESIDLSHALTVNYSVGGTATAGVDYGALSGTAIIPAGSDSVNVPITPINDTLIEGDETVVITATSGSGYTLTDVPTTTVTITEWDGILPGVTVLPTATAAEAGPTPGAFTISRATFDLSQSLTVNYAITGTAIGGTDYAALSGMAIIPAGADRVDIVVTPVADGITEGTETVILTLGTSSAYDIGDLNAATVPLSDVVLADVSIIASMRDASEPGTAGEFTISRSASDLSQPLTVSYTATGSTTAGTDFTALSGTAIIPANSASVTIAVTPIDDLTAEGDETLDLTINAGSAYNIVSDFTFDEVVIADNETSLNVTPPQTGPKIYDVNGNEYPASITIFGGEAAHFRALANTTGANATNNAAFDTKYHWDFTDPVVTSDPYHEYNANLKSMDGFNAAHVWDAPAAKAKATDVPKTFSYTVKLTVTPPSGSATSRTMTIIIQNPEDFGFKKLYVDAIAGKDTNAGTITAPVKTVSKVNTLLNSGSSGYGQGKVIVLFHADQTFDSTGGNGSTALSVNKSHLIFDWYAYKAVGGSKRPILRDNTNNVTGRIFFQCGASTNFLQYDICSFRI